MSFLKSIDSIIHSYINEISKKYDLDIDELQNLWNKDANNIQLNKNSPIELNNKKENVINSSLSSLSRNELVELCKLKNLKITSRTTKSQLIELLSKEDSKISEKINKIEKPPEESKNVIKKLVAQIPKISIKRNKFNILQHDETLFVFTDKDKRVYGKQNSDGSIKPLTKDDIDLCNKFKFLYSIPDNLDTKDSLKNVELDELDEEVEEVEEEVDEDDEDEEDVVEEEEDFEEDFYEE